MSARGPLSAVAIKLIDVVERCLAFVRNRLAPRDKGDIESNIEWNRHSWGELDRWEGAHQYGTRWDAGNPQPNYEAAEIADQYLAPYLPAPYGLTILELAPGAGRFTAELVRHADTLVVVDMNEACLTLCRERFKYYRNMEFVLNDGTSCADVPRKEYDLIASFDSMVHMSPPVIERYVEQFADLVKPGGILWLDHSAKGQKQSGHRSSMTDREMRACAERFGLEVVAQPLRNDHDCISVLRRPQSA